ncbi:MAG: DUF4258 domain-containing protein [Desulfobacteraceae bacterium]|nr:DUF4258 domain-containing protein [Desulfobacteraceae bacterium]
MSPLQRIRQAIREEHYRISTHANDEMAEDALEIADIEHIVITGKMFRKLTQDFRGIRYTIVGETADRRIGYVVCRFLDSGTLLIITAYI